MKPRVKATVRERLASLKARANLLDRLKLLTSRRYVARSEFRHDVYVIWNLWDGKTPLLWLSADEGTSVVDLKKPGQVKPTTLAGRLRVKLKRHPDAKVHHITREPDGSYAIAQVSEPLALMTIYEHHGVLEKA